MFFPENTSTEEVGDITNNIYFLYAHLPLLTFYAFVWYHDMQKKVNKYIHKKFNSRNNLFIFGLCTIFATDYAPILLKEHTFLIMTKKSCDSVSCV